MVKLNSKHYGIEYVTNETMKMEHF